MPNGVEGLLDVHEGKDSWRAEGVVGLEARNDPQKLIVHVDSRTEAGL